MQTSIWWSPDVTGMSSSQTTNTKIKLSLFPPFSYLDTLETISAEFIQSVQPLYTCTGYAVQDTHWAKKSLTPSLDVNTFSPKVMNQLSMNDNFHDWLS